MAYVHDTGMREGNNYPYAPVYASPPCYPPPSLDNAKNQCNNGGTAVPDKPDYRVLTEDLR